MSYFYLFPYRCQICSHRFKAFKLFRRYVKHSVDRRQFERIETNLSALFSCPGKQGEARVIDISVAGCRLESDAQLEQEILLTLEIQTPREEATLSVEGIVRASKPSFMGIQFLRFSDDGQRRLRQMMLKQLAVANIKA